MYGEEGANASASQVATLASYAEAGLGNSKALSDCKAYPGTCKSVYYFDPNLIYDSVLCPYSPDSSLIAAASESWYVHQPGYTDSGHRVYGRYPRYCNGSTTSIYIWLMNNSIPAVQDWWRTELHTYADGYDVFFMDNTQATVVDQTWFAGSGGGCLPWPSICYTTQELPTDAAVQAEQASYANSLNHVNGQPMQFAFNSINFDGASTSPDVVLFSASSRFVAGVCEGCAVEGGTHPSNYYRILNTMAAFNHTAQGAFVLHSIGSASTGSSEQLLERLVTTGLVWLGYSPGHTVAWPDLDQASPTNLAIWPEDLIFPSQPVESMVSGASDLQVATGVWRREFGACFQATHFFGNCAAFVNATSSAVAIQSSWLSQSYGHILTMSGGDVESGGSANVTSAVFTPGTTIVPAYGAVILTK